jgi:hypothetical protein
MPSRRGNGEDLAVATILLIALRIGGAVAGSLLWYWRLPHPVRQAADARTRDHIERTYGISM